MKIEIKRALLWGAGGLSRIWRLLPGPFRDAILTGLLILESRGDAAQGLKRLFLIKDRLEWVINERAMVYGDGVHPKHRLINYHDYFVERIPAGGSVLDIGCGHGVVARSIARRVAGCTVVGVELSQETFLRACASDVPPNLSFVNADARTSLPKGHWDVVVLSNILEHIEDRVGFLQDILHQATPCKVLIRVPLFERDWQMPMRKELGVYYFSDSEHFIEHRVDELMQELSSVGLLPINQITLWGEIWVECHSDLGAK